MFPCFCEQLIRWLFKFHSTNMGNKEIESYSNQVHIHSAKHAKYDQMLSFSNGENLMSMLQQ